VNANVRTGIALVICAPSGTGKTTLIKRLLQEFPHFAFSVSCTTRPPRPDERNGVDYEFLDIEEFERRRVAGFFAEWAEVHGNYYGTPLEVTCRLLAEGRDMLFDIDVQGASQIRRTISCARLIFILPPSLAELERRLRSRGTESEQGLALRLSKAAHELSQAYWFNIWIINNDLEQAWQDLRAAYIAATLSPVRWPGFLDSLLKDWEHRV